MGGSAIPWLDLDEMCRVCLQCLRSAADERGVRLGLAISPRCGHFAFEIGIILK